MEEMLNVIPTPAFSPAKGRLLIKMKDLKDKKMDSGLVLPEKAAQSLESPSGTIISVAKDVEQEFGYTRGMHVALSVSVAMNPGHYAVTLDRQFYLCIYASDITGIFTQMN